MAARDRSPWMGTINLATANTAERLSTLILATTNPPLTPPSPAPLVAEYLTLQVAITEGGAKVFVGNDDVSSTNAGYELVAGASIPPYSLTGNHMSLGDIWLVSDANNTTVHVTFITR